MAAKGYTDQGQVAAYLGLTLTPAQNLQAAALLAAAEARVDGHCHRAWLVGARTDEEHYAPSFGRELFVRFPPVATVDAVKGRLGFLATEAALVAGVDYEVRDLGQGRLWLRAPGYYDRVRVSYTPLATVPEEVRLATTIVAADLLSAALRPDTFGIESYTLPDLSVKFAAWSAGRALPPAAEALLAPYVLPVTA